MSNIPGLWTTLPGVYGPGGSIEILEKDDEYTIGFRPISTWGFFITGTVEKIAQDIIIRMADSDYSHYGFIYVSFKPEVVCTFKPNVLVSPFVVNFKFTQELTEALKRLRNLLPFI